MMCLHIYPLRNNDLSSDITVGEILQNVLSYLPTDILQDSSVSYILYNIDIIIHLSCSIYILLITEYNYNYDVSAQIFIKKLKRPIMISSDITVL